MRPRKRSHFLGYPIDITGRVHARAELPALIDRCASGHFHPEHVTSRVVPFSQSAEEMTDSGPKLVFKNDWPA